MTDTPTTPEAPVAGTPEYNAAMADKYETAQAGPAPVTPAPSAQIPEGGSAKFARPDGTYDWQSHAKEVEYKLAQRGQPAQAQSGPDEFIEAPKQDANAVRDTLAQFNAAVAGGNQEASREAAQKLLQAGIPREMLAQQAQATQMAKQHQTTQAQSFVGETLLGDASKGTEAVDQLRTWARSNLSAEEQAEVAQALSGPGWKYTVQALATRMGAGGTISVDMGAPSGGVAAFANQGEMVSAMKDPRYKTDESYRNQVRQRVGSMR